MALIVQETGVSLVDKTESSRQLVDESQAIERYSPIFAYFIF